ncbi:hypothetical protein [Pontibacter sp. SGAir0037]|uniref:hypothetical protein n=1 Tax=Pontibacter sp. SGAir0037 TaxID=2571030 RepID=UPI0010CD51E9|nr:hypothetical protein [Pontibacter sp. SGAir0037]QCR22444.1 hypothetical protein C1N53_08915 [Pontibacter sp. SGAir0037]
MKRILLILILQVLVRLSFGQTISVFDTKLYSEKVDLCDITSKFIDLGKEFKYYPFGSDFFSVSAYDNSSDIYGHWSFVVRQDSLNQIGFTSLEYPITAENYDRLYRQADKLIKQYTSQYGQPVKSNFIKKEGFENNKSYNPNGIHKAMWLIDGQKLKVEFGVDGEHGEFHYSLSILRFKDYFSNMKLPPHWDGY